MLSQKWLPSENIIGFTLMMFQRELKLGETTVSTEATGVLASFGFGHLSSRERYASATNEVMIEDAKVLTPVAYATTFLSVLLTTANLLREWQIRKMS